jgi:hypothetical protein
MSPGLETTRDSRVLEDVAALGGTFGDPKMTPRPRPNPPVPPMRPYPEPVAQGPFQTNDAALWMSPERRAAMVRAEAADAAEQAAERQRRYVSGTGRPGDPFVFADVTVEPASEWQGRKQLDREADARRKARRDRMLATVAGARYPGDHYPEGEND